MYPPSRSRTTYAKEYSSRNSSSCHTRSTKSTSSLTASVGVSTLPDVSTTAEGLIQAADQAMYWVKDRGKNGIRVAVS